MSGGVDSAVAAALLKEQGYEVVGVFMKFWTEPICQLKTNQIFGERKAILTAKSYAENKCCSAEAEKIARQIAEQLGIPFYVMNFKNPFKKAVVDYFLREYAAGRTPNPCVACNKKIKFGLLFKKISALGGDFLATGHYVKKIEKRKSKSGKQLYGIFRAKDKKKDQSYFLYNLKQTQLKRLLFPLGDYTKNEVRKMAKKFVLPVALKESFDICFVAENDHYSFLKRHLKLRPGVIIDQSGRKIGEHQGLALYTIGQRRHINIGGGPYYVTGFDREENALLVTSDYNDPRLFKKILIAKEINWVSRQAPDKRLKLTAKIRYAQKAIGARVEYLSKRKYKVIFERPQRAITPGQSIVFYGGRELVGGGVIFDAI